MGNQLYIYVCLPLQLPLHELNMQAHFCLFNFYTSNISQIFEQSFNFKSKQNVSTNEVLKMRNFRRFMKRFSQFAGHPTSYIRSFLFIYKL